ncbi:hypothetical protein MTR67_048682 [Solanum verrucosum]|uniref:Uncharacterized protein n=1 Tax=Solanum verrucosum TaxID=315347 RepID=A0AAF0UYX0_SOLVR|nr:hypothetical protein MTR67_048682 [Solanum verrucosum]
MELVDRVGLILTLTSLSIFTYHTFLVWVTFCFLLTSIISCISIFYLKNTQFSFMYMLQWHSSTSCASVLDTSCSSPRRRRHDKAVASPFFALSNS